MMIVRLDLLLLAIGSVALTILIYEIFPPQAQKKPMVIFKYWVKSTFLEQVPVMVKLLCQ